MKRRDQMKTVIATLAAIMFLLPAVSMAQQCEILRQADKLDLTDQQIEQLQASALAQHKEMIQLRADLQTAKLELRELMTNDSIDKGQVMKKSDEISGIKAEMAKKRLDGKINRLNMLTDTQRAKLRKDMMMRGPHHGRRDGRHMMRGDGPCPYSKGDTGGKWMHPGIGRQGQFDSDDDD
jgi:Spy/CpxP family protein refolding chaperone